MTATLDGSDGNVRDQRTSRSPIFRQPEPTVVQDPEPAVPGEPDGLPVVLAGPEPGRGHRAALALARDRGEEVPVRGIQIREGLLQHHRRHVAQPDPLGSPLRLGDQTAGQLGVGNVLLTRLPRSLAQPEPVVEHHPRTPERPRQLGLLPDRRVDAELVTELHEKHPNVLVYG
jgi:hypothetical protein